MYVQLAHCSKGDWKRLYIAHVIVIIKSEISTIVIIFSRGCVSEISLIAYTFLGNQEFVFIFVQFMMSANSPIRFGLQIVFVCWHNTPYHYHHCANLSENIDLKMPVRYILSSVWVRWSIFSQLSTIQYVGRCVFSLPISLVMIERMYVLGLIIIIKSEVGTITHCLGLDRGMHCMSFYILIIPKRWYCTDRTR